MKIQVNENGTDEETEIVIHCKTIDKKIEKIMAMLRVFDLKLTGVKDKETYILEVPKILYIDTVDKKTFFSKVNL